MDIPETAYEALADAFQDSVSVILHTWTTGAGDIHAALATSPEEAFDEEEQSFDVDRIEMVMVSLRHELGDEAWSVEIESGFGMGDIFADLVEAYFDVEEDVEEA